MTTDVGDIVLDPFNGTGTTVIATKRLGRKYAGIELDNHYVAIAEEKLKHIRPDSHIGGVWVSKYLNGISTIRDKDWNALKEHFHIPDPIPLLEYDNIVYKNGKIRKHNHVPKDTEEILVLPFDDVAPRQGLAARTAHN